MNKVLIDKDIAISIGYLLSAATSVDTAYRQIESIPNKNVLTMKLELGKIVKELRNLQERLISEASNLDTELYVKNCLGQQ